MNSFVFNRWSEDKNSEMIFFMECDPPPPAQIKLACIFVTGGSFTRWCWVLAEVRVLHPATKTGRDMLLDDSVQGVGSQVLEKDSPGL